MTSQQDQISTLIADIDGILHKTSYRRSWLVSGNGTPQLRPVLERVRNYLLSLQQAADTNQTSVPLVGTNAPPANDPAQVMSRQIMQAVATEMESWRTNWMMPLEAEMETWRQQRDSLIREIQQLESTRQQYSSLAQQQARQQQMITEFLQVLMERLQETVNQQVVQTLKTLEARFLAAEATQYPTTANPQTSTPLHPQERLEHLRMLQVQSDQLLLTLDSTLRTVFDVLQRNVQSYQDSLTQGLENIHNLGQQSEVVVSSLVNQLTEQLGQSVSARAQFSPGTSGVVGTEGLLPPTNLPQANLTDIPLERQIQSYESATSDTLLPYPGTSVAGGVNFPKMGDIVSRDELPFPGIELPYLQGETQSSNSPLISPISQIYPPSTSTQPGFTSSVSGSQTDAQSSSSQAINRGDSAEAAIEDLDISALDWENLSVAELDDDDMQTLLQLDAVLGIEPERNSSEIDDFYESLFGADPLTETDDPVVRDSAALMLEPMLTNQTAHPQENFDLNLSTENSFETSQYQQTQEASTRVELASEIEQALFEGLADLAEESVQTQQTEANTPELWDDLFASEELATAAIPISSSAEITAVTSAENQNVETPLVISALTDLFPESAEEVSPPINPIGQSYGQDYAEANSSLHSGGQPSTLNPANPEEDIYIPASPDESLLTRDNAESTGEQEIDFWLDQETLQQLSEDLSSFGGTEQIQLYPENEEILGTAEEVEGWSSNGVSEEASPGIAPFRPAEAPIQTSFEQEEVNLDSNLGSEALANPSADLEDLGRFADLDDFELLNAIQQELTRSTPESVGSSAESDLELLPLEELTSESADETIFEPAAVPESPSQVEETLDESPSAEEELDSLLSPEASPEAEAAPVSESLPTENIGSEIQPQPLLAEALIPEAENAAEEAPLSDSPQPNTSETTAEATPDSAEAIIPAAPDSTPLDSDSSDSEKKNLITLEPEEQQTSTETVGTVSSPQRREDPPQFQNQEANNGVWYLGIDIGTSSLSSVLLNSLTGARYPIYWTTVEEASVDRSFRLPAVVYSGPDGNDLGQSSGTSMMVGSLVYAQEFTQTGILIQNFKPHLKIGIPYRGPCLQSPSEESNRSGEQGVVFSPTAAVTQQDWEQPYSSPKLNWQPVLQWSGQEPISLYWVSRALQALVATLKPEQVEVTGETQLRTNLIGATNLNPETLRSALDQLRGVILGCPAGWGEQYRFNLREAILDTQLVNHSEQIFFLEDAIATVLAGMSGSSLPEVPWKGGTLVINAGATTTELALVNLPDNFHNLTHRDFSLRSLPYAGNAIDQDIICQLLYPQTKGDASGSSSMILSPDLEIPAAGQPDLAIRYRLASQLQSSPLGQALLEAASYLKRILQHQESYALELGGHSWQVTRRELESRVLSPFIEQLNRELNALFVETGLSGQEINQIICTGGTTGVGEIAKWLQRKLPKAILIRDTGSSDSPTTCSPVAYGLATLPLYPQVLERHSHQYSDYFLLLELLRALPDTTSSIEEIMQLLEYRGINTRICQDRLMAYLEGELPLGLVPSSAEFDLLTPPSQQNPDYTLVQSAPLFYKEAPQRYRPNLQQCDYLRRYLNTILASTHQQLEEPLSLNLTSSRL